MLLELLIENGFDNLLFVPVEFQEDLLGKEMFDSSGAPNPIFGA